MLKSRPLTSHKSLYTLTLRRGQALNGRNFFEDETYLQSMKIARWHIFGAAVADLALYLGAMMVIKAGITEQALKQCRNRSSHQSSMQYDQDDISQDDFLKMIKKGLARCQKADWQDLAEGP